MIDFNEILNILLEEFGYLDLDENGNLTNPDDWNAWGVIGSLQKEDVRFNDPSVDEAVIKLLDVDVRSRADVSAIAAQIDELVNPEEKDAERYMPQVDHGESFYGRGSTMEQIFEGWRRFVTESQSPSKGSAQEEIGYLLSFARHMTDDPEIKIDPNAEPSPDWIRRAEFLADPKNFKFYGTFEDMNENDIPGFWRQVPDNYGGSGAYEIYSAEMQSSRERERGGRPYDSTEKKIDPASLNHDASGL